jgi:hypothetical protein
MVNMIGAGLLYDHVINMRIATLLMIEIFKRDPKIIGQMVYMHILSLLIILPVPYPTRKWVQREKYSSKARLP